MANLSNECRHVMPSGLRCESPALRGTQLCYFHSRLSRVKRDGRAPDAPLTFPNLEDRAAIQIALGQVADAVASEKLSPAQASVLLRTFRLASQNLSRSPRMAARLAIDNVCDSEDGEDIVSDPAGSVG